MENILVFVANSVEMRSFGMNSSTFWAMGVMFITFVQAYGLFEVSRAIYRNESGRGVSLYMLGYWHALMWCFAYHAWNVNSIVMMFNGVVLATLYTVALFAVVRHEGFSRVGFLKIVIPLLVMPSTFMIFSGEDVLLLVLMVIGLIFLLDQTRVLYAEKRVGSFEPRFIYTLLLASIFWFFFAVSIGEFALTIINPMILLISLVTLHAYGRASRHEQLMRI